MTHNPSARADKLREKMDERLRILLVEDNRADAVLLQEMLLQDAPGQFDLAWTTSLRETLERLGREPFDAVLLDLSLPDSHGLETITRLSAAVPAMPILVITGLTDEHVAGEAVRCGAEDYLVKGQTDARSMIRAIRYAIDRKQGEEALRAARDSAEQAKAAAEHANRAKDHFLAVLSHELRTPLTPVMMGLSMLQDQTDLAPAVQETLEMVRRNVELEARLIDDLLDVSRIAQGKIELNRGPVELCTIIQRAVEVCKPDIEARRLHFGVDLGPAAPYWIEADAARLQQVFWNLLKNAVKFTPHGGCVGIRCRPNESARGRRGQRQRDRHRTRGARADLQRLRAGGTLDHAAVRRPGPGIGDQQGPGGDARGPDRGPERGPGQGRDVPRPAAVGRARRPARSARPGRGPAARPSAPCASCWSKTTASRRS